MNDLSRLALYVYESKFLPFHCNVNGTGINWNLIKQPTSLSRTPWESDFMVTAS
jgi:hypothetical protein